MSDELDNTPYYKLTSNGRVFAVKDKEQEAQFEILSFDGLESEEVHLVCLTAHRIFYMSYAEAETLAAELLNAVAEARSSRSPQSSPEL